MTEEENQPKEELIHVSTELKQLVQRKISQAVRIPEVPHYPLFEASQFLRAKVGDDVLRKSFGDKWNDIKKQYSKVGILISDIKSFYDFMMFSKDKDLNSEKFSKERINYRRAMALVLINLNKDRIFVELLDKVDFKNIPIPNEAFKAEERSARGLSLKEEEYGS